MGKHCWLRNLFRDILNSFSVFTFCCVYLPWFLIIVMCLSCFHCLKGKRKDRRVTYEKLDNQVDDQYNSHTSEQERTKVQIWNHRQTVVNGKFTVALKGFMGNFNWINAAHELDLNVPLIVFCQFSTRLQSDLNSEIKNIAWSSGYAVIIIHTGSESNLPLVPSADKLNINGKKIKLIDMGLSDGHSFHDCKFNQVAKVKLQEYIDTFRRGSVYDTLAPDNPV